MITPKRWRETLKKDCGYLADSEQSVRKTVRVCKFSQYRPRGRGETDIFLLMRNLMQGLWESKIRYPVESSKSFYIFCGLVVTVVGIVGGGPAVSELSRQLAEPDLKLRSDHKSGVAEVLAVSRLIDALRKLRSSRPHLTITCHSSRFRGIAHSAYTATSNTNARV